MPALTAVAAFAADDVTAPSLVSARVQPGLVNVTKSEADVAVTVHATDDQGLGYVSLTLTGPAGSEPITQGFYAGDDWYTDAVFMAGERTDGWWTTRVSVPQGTAPGAWHLASVTLQDDSENQRTVDGAALPALPSPSQLDLQVQRQEHVNADKPAVSALSVSPSSVDVTSAEATAQVRFRVVDAVDGITSGTVRLTDSTNALNWSEYAFSSGERATGTQYDGTYAVDVSIPRAASAGTTSWAVTVSATDGYGTATAPVSAGTLSQVAQADGVAPVLTSVSVQPSAGDASVDEVPFTVTVKGTDNPSNGSSRSSGIVEGWVTLTGPGGTEVSAHFDQDALLDGTTPAAATFFAQGWLPARSAAGPWTVTSAHVVDGYGNSSSVLPAAGAGQNRTLQVTTTPDTHGASLTGLQIAPAAKNVRYDGWYAFVGTAHVNAPDSGFDHANLVMTGPDGVTSFTTESAFGRWNISSGSAKNGDFRVQFDPRWDYEWAYYEAHGEYPVSSLGTYTITKVVLFTGEDVAKSTQGSGVTSLTGFTTSVKMVDTDDTVAPTVSGVTVPSSHVTLGTVEGDHTAVLPVSVQDTADAALHQFASGVDHVDLTLERTDGQQTQQSWWYDYGDASGSDQDAVLPVQLYFWNGEHGSWHVSAISVVDRAGNRKDYTGAAAAALAPGTIVVDPPADSVAPELTGITLGTGSVNSTAGAVSVPVVVKATDASGVSYAYVSLTSPSGSQYVGASYLECVAGTCSGNLDVPQYAESGTWHVDWVTVGDAFDNWRDYFGPDLPQSAAIQSTLEVTGLVDGAAPVVQSLDFDPTSSSAAPLDVTAAEKTVVVNVRVTDAQSGVGWLWADLANENRDYSLYLTRVQGDGHDGIYQGSIRVPRFTPSGDYAVTVYAHDNFGNFDITDAADLGTGGHYWIHGLTDGAAPVVSAVTLPTAVNSTAGGTSAPFDVTVSDALSGFSSGTIEYLRPGDDADEPRSVYFDAQDELAGASGTYRVSIPVLQYAPSGTWQVTALYVQDAFGNGKTLTGPDLTALGNTSFTVTALTDASKPQLTSVTITPTTVHLGGEEQLLQASVVASDTGSGISEGRVVLTSPDGVQQSDYGYFNRGDETGADKYPVSLYLPRNARPGTWTLTVDLYDMAGNRTTVQSADLPVGSTKSVEVDNTFDGVVHGTVKDKATSTPVSGASVSVCTEDWYFCAPATTAADGTYSVSHLPNGQYLVNVSPPGTYESTTGYLGGGDLYDHAGHTGVVDVTLTAPTPPPAGVEVESSMNEEPGSVPTQYWEDPFVVTVSDKCTGGTGTVDVEFDEGGTDSGELVETSTPGTYKATLAAFYPHHGSATVTIHLDCPGTGDADIPFDIYVDPSGYVLDQDKKPVVGATVTLLRSETQAGPYVAVPNGSTIMSPSNRKNPDTSDSTGHYGWDVTAGWYQVQVSKTHCYVPGHPETKTLTSKSVNVPPAVMDLDLTLDCTNVAPTAVLADPPTGKMVGDLVSFTSTASDANGAVASYDWDFGDGSTHGTTAAPSHSYATAGDYVVKLVVTDDQGLKSAVVSKTVHIAARPAPQAQALVTTPGVSAAGLPTLTVSWTGSPANGGAVVCVVAGSAALTAPDSSCTDVAAPATSLAGIPVATGMSHSVSVIAYQVVGGSKIHAAALTRTLGASYTLVGKGGTITSGGTFAVTGRLLNVGTLTAVPGRVLQLWSRTATAGAAWAATGTVVPTDSLGYVRAVVKPAKNTQYAWRFAGFSDGATLDLLGDTSEAVTVLVSQRVTAKATSTSPRHGTKVYVYGTALPQVVGQVCYLQRYTGGTWKNVANGKTAKMKLPNGVTTVMFKLGVTPAKAGTYTYRVYRPATSVNKAGYSAKVVVKAT